jgi:DNA-binding NarL/FixJ family response regulator
MRILLVDDHPLYLDAACNQIRRAFQDAEILTFTAFAEAVAAVTHRPVDLVMLDYSLPGADGPGSVRHMVKAAAGKPVVVMSGVASARDIHACIEAGARGYLPKSMEGQVFTDAVSVVLHGGTYVPAEFIGALTACAAMPLDNEAFARFSRRERDLLRLIAAGASNKEIAMRLGILEVTVKSYLTRLFARLQVKNRSQAAVLASQMKLPPED